MILPMFFLSNIFLAPCFMEAFKYRESMSVFFFSYSSVDLSRMILYPLIRKVVYFSAPARSI